MPKSDTGTAQAMNQRMISLIPSLPVRARRYQAAQASAYEQTLAQQGQADIAQLKQEWGQQYEANTELGRRAARSFGVEPEAIDKIAQALGVAETIKLFACIGGHLGEGTLAPAAGGTSAQGGAKSLADLLYPSMAQS